MTNIKMILQSNFRWGTQFCKQGGSGWKGAQLTICWPKALPVVTSNHHQLVIRSFAPTRPRISLPDILPGQRDKTSGIRCKWRTNKVVSTQEGAQVASGSASGFDLGRPELSSLCDLVSLSPGQSDFDICRKPASVKDNAGQKVI